MNQAQSAIFANAANAMASIVKRPLLFGPDNRPLQPSSGYQYSRSASKREGSMKNWIPKRLVTRQQEALEREAIVARSIDLTNNDPHAAGVVESFATTVVGAGLAPHPLIGLDTLGLTKDEIRAIVAQQRTAYMQWAPIADAGGRMSFGALQFLIMRNVMQYGEYIALAPMIDDPLRPYALACQIIHPLRLKTPVDKINDPAIRDGVELGAYGEPVAYWIKKTDPKGSSITPDVSANFLRIPARKGHRWNVLHDFVVKDPEQVRGYPPLAPGMKFFRDLNDYLDAELVSNIVTAAFALFIEQAGGNDPFNIAENLSSFQETVQRGDGKTEKARYQEWIPGQIMYGNPGEKPAPITASRPGTTFDPFTRIIKKALSMALNMPYPVLFKDVEATNFAGFRSAMLDAWRVYMHLRTWLGQGFCQRFYTMLMEEAYLRGNLNVKNFYSNMFILTQAEWRGSPKGDIEPIKAVQADVLAIQNNLKTRAEAIAERTGGDVRTTFDQLQEEQEMMRERGLTEKPIEPDSQQEPAGAVDDMEGAGEGLEQS
ncbi:MAG TPA: phage portal protein [Sedimentisphaerales bacterium]|nr:phage portal protein [Sedimentisphaerales bacterium]